MTPGQALTRTRRELRLSSFRTAVVAGDSERIQRALTAFAAARGCTYECRYQSGELLEAELSGEDFQLIVQARSIPADGSGTLALPAEGAKQSEVVITGTIVDCRPIDRLLDDVVKSLRQEATAYTDDELDQIVANMPLLKRYAQPDAIWNSWALIFRDHYVENSVGFLLGCERAGLAPEWIYALSKGDRTAHRERVHATFLERGYRSAVLDNSVIDGTAGESMQQQALLVGAEVNEFIRLAHQAGRRVLVIDDGGLIAQGRATGGGGWERIDGAIELTVSGLRRISRTDVDVPVFNMARSRLKTHIAYAEIADSCLRRVRSLLHGQKFFGRRAVCLGFGTLGARIARGLRASGVRVVVVDTSPLALIRAAEEGFETARSLRAALEREAPFLITGSTGAQAVTPEDLTALPNGVFLAGFATKDFSLFSLNSENLPVRQIADIGTEYVLPDGGSVVLLGDGRSLNLYEAEGIPNQGYDAYRAGTYLVATAMCRSAKDLPPGVHLEVADQVIEDAGLFDAYYDTYIATDAAGRLNRPSAE
ncbi:MULTISPECIES: hypothetical protein [unclassified Streptomyces]|uniref:hypothetical protein n=1 Tax=unclassified Streptomyces TaxID=2593676 RepID=UPI0022517656|nr:MULTISPECIES: hypothetical protein [unclassified Streptomyces]MCX4406088.1 hypothetical protein [Streptomyces sp. NBC_01764]MCX5189387.1 hypothetical protein [Streptomyces sp. NBC_00268]